MAGVILSAVVALFADLRALGEGYTDDAAFGRAIAAFVAVIVVLQVAGIAWRAFRPRLALTNETRETVPEAQPVAAYPPRPVHLPRDDDAGHRGRAA